jgi:hypothetical protein
VTRWTAGSPKGRSIAALAVALAACSGGEAAPQNSAATPQALAATGSAEPAFPPWKSEGECYWVLTYPDGVAHRAWISGGDGGVFLNIVDDSIAAWPVSDALDITLAADASDRRLKARGSHRDGDGATLLTLILDEPQRALIAGTRTITLASAGREPFTLAMAGAPGRAEMDRCDANPGPGEFSEE